MFLRNALCALLDNKLEKPAVAKNNSGFTLRFSSAIMKACHQSASAQSTSEITGRIILRAAWRVLPDTCQSE